MLRLRYSAASKDDLKAIACFIAKDKPAAARRWVEKIREKCRIAAQHQEIGDDRCDLGEGIRSTYVGNYIIFFRAKCGSLEVVRIVRGDLEFPFR